MRSRNKQIEKYVTYIILYGSLTVFVFFIIFDLAVDSPRRKEADKLIDKALDKVELYDFNGALTDFNKSIELHPKYETHFLRGVLKNTLDDYIGAIADFTVAIEFELREYDIKYEEYEHRSTYNFAKKPKHSLILPQIYWQRGISKQNLCSKMISSEYDHKISLRFKRFLKNKLHGLELTCTEISKSGCEDLKKARKLGYDKDDDEWFDLCN
jgi:hypothetical protein